MGVETYGAPVFCVDDDGKYRYGMRRPEDAPHRIGQKEFPNAAAADPDVPGQATDECSGDSVISRQLLRQGLGQIVERQGIGAEGIEANDTKRPVHSDEDPCNVSPFVLAGAPAEPVVEVAFTTRERRPVVVAR